MLLDEFREYLTKKQPGATGERYARAAALLLRFFTVQHWTVLTAPTNAICAWSEANIARGCKASTVRVYVAAAVAFMKWLRRRDPRVPKFDEVCELPKVKGRLPQFLDRDGLPKYITGCSPVPEPYRSAMLLLPFCGLRIQEMCDLRVKNLEDQGKWKVIHVVGKGGKYRAIPLARRGTRILLSYMRGWRSNYAADLQKSPEDRALFPCLRRDSDPIRPGRVRAYMQQVRGRAGLPTITPHTMRRTYATQLFLDRVPLRYIQELLGHSKIETTMRYIGLDGDQMRDYLDHSSV